MCVCLCVCVVCMALIDSKLKLKISHLRKSSVTPVQFAPALLSILMAHLNTQKFCFGFCSRARIKNMEWPSAYVTLAGEHSVGEMSEGECLVMLQP